MSKVNNLLSSRFKKASKKISKMTDLAELSTSGKLSSFSGVFRVTPLSESEQEQLRGILSEYSQEGSNIPDDLKFLSAITSEVKAINNQAAILHGERIKRAQEAFKNYREGAFSSWMMSTYGNRQTPYNFLQYFDFYSGMPKSLQEKVDTMPRQAVYALATRNCPKEDKTEIVENYKGESKQELLTLIRERFPLAPKDKRAPSLAEQSLILLQQVEKQFKQSRFKPTNGQKKTYPRGPAISTKESLNQYTSPLSTRYSSDEMSQIFSPQFKYSTWRRLWVALAKCEKAIGLPITPEQIKSMESHIDEIDFERVKELEIKTRHDVVAHIHAFAEVCPEAKGIIHLGATSSYVTDNTDVIQLRAGLRILKAKSLELLRIMRPLSHKFSTLPTVGYTHFQPAQPVSVGKRICLWMQDFLVDCNDIIAREEELHFLGLKGAVGTQASFMSLLDGDSYKVEKLDELIAIEMGFEKLYTITAQTYTRKQDMRVLAALEGLAATSHKCATDLRLLAHLGEMEESREKTQVGSSAMPHKRNPIRAERICGLSRFLISICQNGTHNFANQWLERTLDDSANRRLTHPEAFLTADAILNLLLTIFSDLDVDKTCIEMHLKEKMPQLALENILMIAVKKGRDRQETHEMLRTRAQKMEKVAKELGLTLEEIETCKKPNIGRCKDQVDRFLSEKIDPFLSAYKDLTCPPYKIDL